MAGGGQTPRIRILNDSNPTRFLTSPDVYVFSDCEHLLVFDYVRYRFDLIAAAIYRSIGKPSSLVGDQYTEAIDVSASAYKVLIIPY